MKKIIPILFVLFLIYGYQNKEEIFIPADAIRFRVIANSNSMEDQQLKLKVKEEVENDLNKLMINTKTSTEAKQKIAENLVHIREKVNTIAPDNQVSFGKNYFPSKEYQGVTYAEGQYDSLVITLGNGIGQNWWCVMFPPLCLLEAKENQTDEVEYKLLIKEILHQYES